MDTLILIFRILFIIIGSLTAIVYILFQFYQKVPKAAFKLITADYLVYSLVALIFGFGTNSYYGLASFVPLLLLKYATNKSIVPEKLNGSGFWMEIDWKKLTPRGFNRNVPKHILDEMNKMLNSTPKDTHFIVPRFYAIIAVKFMLRKMQKESKNMPTNFSAQQQNMGMEQINMLAQNILNLSKGKSEKKDFNIGVLKITRH